MYHDNVFVRQAIEKSRESVMMGAFPVGALVVCNDSIIGAGVSNMHQLLDPTSHAEIASIREACQSLSSRDLDNATLYSSLEPCLMCYGASLWASIGRVVYACPRNRVSSRHSEGTHDLAAINALARRPLKLVHLDNLTEEAFEVINEWEVKNPSA